MHTDCAGASPVCDVSGYTIEFEAVSGPNAGDLGAAVTDVTGTATKTYADVLDGAGLDTLRSCLDVDLTILDSGSETAAECIAESGSDAYDTASNTVVKRWEGMPTLTLKNLDQAATIASIVAGGGPVYTTSPAYNPVASMHTVQATIGTGSDADLGVCAGTTTTPGAVCDVVSDCSGAAPICDLSGYPVGFTVTSGPNTGDIGWAFTNTAGIATISYPDAGGAGQDSISSCLDTDAGIPFTSIDSCII